MFRKFKFDGLVFQDLTLSWLLRRCRVLKGSLCGYHPTLDVAGVYSRLASGLKLYTPRAKRLSVLGHVAWLQIPRSQGWAAVRNLVTISTLSKGAASGIPQITQRSGVTDHLTSS